MSGRISNWLRASWDLVRTSLWVLPGAMFAAGAILAVVLLGLDSRTGAPTGGSQSWVSAGSGEDARNLLSTLLTSVIAMASIVFSITVLSLSLATNTYGPRLVRTFRSSKRTQIVLGTFMMTIVYLLLVLRALRGDADPAEVPAIAVFAGSALALACVVALLVFIQGVASLMVADEVVRRVRVELDSAIRELPRIRSHDANEEGLPDGFEQKAHRVRLPREGYVQSVDYEDMVEWAAQRGAVIRLDFRPGDFVVEGDHKLLVHPEPADPEAARRELDRLIVSGDERTPTQDLEFAIRHLVEVAVRALSPGINDPFTAMAVVDRLRGGLARLAARQMPEEQLFDQKGKLRVVRDVNRYAGAVDAAFNQIRQSAAQMPSVLIHMLKAIGGIAEHTRTPDQRSALTRHAMLIRDAARRDVEDPTDLEDVEQAYRGAVEALQQNSRDR